MFILHNFLSVAQYARQYGVLNRAIFYRIKHKTIAAIKVSDMYFIDIIQSPPVKLVDWRKKAQLKAPAIPDNISLDKLMWVKHYAKNKKISPDFLYEQLILGN